MFLFVGLGNPGGTYAQNRHNVGFLAVEAIAQRYGFPSFRPKFQSLFSEGKIGSARVFLLLPQTYMNLSGRAVGEMYRFYKIDLDHVFVFHDELDLPLARVRIKKGGGNAGHNGLQSISAHIGNEYKRLRIGIDHPGDKALVHGHVLGNFTKLERTRIEDVCEIMAQHVDLLLKNEESSLQNRIALAQNL